MRCSRLLVLIPLAAASLIAADPGPHAVKAEKGVRAAMRDGVELIADVYRPDASGSFPVLLTRTPYDRKNGEGQAREVASHGYIVVVQDTRGRYDSQGEFYPFRHEIDDGYDTVEWAAKLEGANGKVGMFGGSYVGATQMLASISRPPHLVSIFPYVTAAEYYDGWTYQSGAWMQWFSSSWTTGLIQDTLRRKAAQLARPREWAWRLPVEDYALIQTPNPDDLAPYYDDWIEHETDDAYWKRWKISDHYPEMTVKALHAGGWHDIFLKGSIKNYVGIHAKAKDAKVRQSQRLLVGPWAHAGTSAEGKIGDVVFGKQAVLDMSDTIRRFADWALKDIQNEYADDTPVRIFVLGENVWRDEKEFPLERQKLTRYYLRASGGLATEKPSAEKPDEYTYDPANPTPTIGGRLCCGAAIPPGPADQSPNSAREDVLVFSTPPLQSGVEVTGEISLELFASSSAIDTDFTAMFIDVDPSGYERLLTDGIVRARYRNSTEKAELIKPGKVYKYTIDLWTTSNYFQPGHSIRLQVSSSNFPRFNRNLNTGEQTAGSTGMTKADQTVYHDAEHPSALVLPVIPR
ncbi:MAG: CocE/NonD family hydrolase [Acidobacteria bacterium]|nr:CocE/NonD family hydrolase [Acidobacteriota bacterium]